MLDKTEWIWKQDFFHHMDFVVEPIDMTALHQKIATLNKLNTHDDTKAQILSNEIIYSFLIENEVLDYPSIYSSIGRIFNLNLVQNYKWTTKSDDLICLLKDAWSNFSNWDKARVCDYHRCLFFNHPKTLIQHIDFGDYRQPSKGRMRVVSKKPNGEPIVHFIAPHAQDLRWLMDRFYTYVNQTPSTPEQSIAHAFIAHLLFVLIHPLDDGNGRMARLINDNLLAKSQVFPHNCFTISTGIFLTKQDYYAILEKICQQTHNNLTEWVRYGVASLEKGIDFTIQQIALVVLKMKIFKHFARVLNDNEQWIIHNLFEKHLEQMRRPNTDTALHIEQVDQNIQHLVDLKILLPIANQPQSFTLNLAVLPQVQQQTDVKKRPMQF